MENSSFSLRTVYEYIRWPKKTNARPPECAKKIISFDGSEVSIALKRLCDYKGKHRIKEGERILFYWIEQGVEYLGLYTI